ncbi:MAG: DUF354 domain-containing protein [Paludibacteraceae bacterium]
MNILIDIGHPAHVHMFHYFAIEMQKRGHQVLFTCRDKEFEVALLQSFGLKFVNFGKKSTSTVRKIFDLLKFDWKEWRVARRFKPHVFLSHGSITASHVAWLMRRPSIAFEDTFNMEQIRLWKRFANVILTSEYDHPLKSPKVMRYAGYNELLYLHPNRFVPDSAVLKELGVQPHEKYVIMRFVSWNATHDRGHRGLSLTNKLQAVKAFSRYAKIFISSEKPLPTEFEPYRITIAPERMHDAMAYASLIFGESATMVSEGVMLGVPGIYIDDTGRLYTKELHDKYGLCFNYTENETDQQAAINKGVELLQMTERYLPNYHQMLDEHIDVTAFLCWFIENFPQSERIMRQNPDFQYRFK